MPTEPTPDRPIGADLATFLIDLTPGGYGRVVVNGVDVSKNLSGLEIKSQPGMPTLLVLYHQGAAGLIEGTGIVQVVRADVDGTVAFLENIDPEKLDEESLKRSRWGDSPMKAALDVLKEWASGQ